MLSSEAKDVYMAIGAADNMPRCDVAQKQAESVIQALEELRNLPNAVLPKPIVLSSASLEPHLSKDIPPLGQEILKLGFSNLYADLRPAEENLG